VGNVQFGRDVMNNPLPETFKQSLNCFCYYSGCLFNDHFQDLELKWRLIQSLFKETLFYLTVSFCEFSFLWAHPASYPMGTRGYFPGGKAAGAWSWGLTSI
jgi:hypothetical protein